MSTVEPSECAAPAADARRELAPRAILLEWATIAYNVVEGVVAVTFGIITGSIALPARVRLLD